MSNLQPVFDQQSTKTNTSSDPSKLKRVLAKLYSQRYLFLMLAPAVILVLTFNYIPLAGWIIAFKNYQPGLSVLDAPWTGWYQFKAFFVQSADYKYLLRNTLVMNISTLIVNLSAALIFAILINEIRSNRFKKFIQTVTFFPFFISWVIVYAIMHALFAASTGAINESLVSAGIINEGINVLGSKYFSWILIITMEAWKFLGYNAVIFIAAIASIPHEQYEAADIDGASRFGKMRHITLPNLMPTFVVLMIMNSGWILNSNFEQFFLFTNPTNWETMEVLDIYIYKYGLQLGNFPYATAVGIMKTVVSIILVITVNHLAKRLTGKSIL